MNLKVNEKDEVVDVCKAWEEQKKSGKMEMLYSLVQDGTLKADKAADKANLTVTQFVDSMNKAGYKIQSTI